MKTNNMNDLQMNQFVELTEDEKYLVDGKLNVADGIFTVLENVYAYLFGY